MCCYWATSTVIMSNVFIDNYIYYYIYGKQPHKRVVHFGQRRDTPKLALSVHI